MNPTTHLLCAYIHAAQLLKNMNYTVCDNYKFIVTNFKAAIHFYYVLFRYTVLRLLSSLPACSHSANDGMFYLTEKIEAVTQLPSPPLIPSYPRTLLLCSEFHLSRLLGILHCSLQGNGIL